MYLTRTAGIETAGLAVINTDGYECILPALRELKRAGQTQTASPPLMYLTRTAGIETPTA